MVMGREKLSVTCLCWYHELSSMCRPLMPEMCMLEYCAVSILSNP